MNSKKPNCFNPSFLIGELAGSTENIVLLMKTQVTRPICKGSVYHCHISSGFAMCSCAPFMCTYFAVKTNRPRPVLQLQIEQVTNKKPVFTQHAVTVCEIMNASWAVHLVLVACYSAYEPLYISPCFPT